MMDVFQVVIIAVIVLAIIALICGVMLTVASKFMAVEVDEMLPKVRECLPGANCGACGFAGCDGYAAALVEDPDLSITLCVPGGSGAAQQGQDQQKGQERLRGLFHGIGLLFCVSALLDEKIFKSFPISVDKSLL